MRRNMLARRLSISDDEKGRMEKMILETIRDLPAYRDAQSLALYVPVRGEVDLLSLWKGSGKEVFFPKVNGDDLSFHPAESRREFTPGCYGIPEPTCRDACNISDIDCMFVPGVVFDRQRYRLGYGKGYYDRLIGNYPHILTIGVCFDEFLIDSLPVDPWDMNVDLVVTQSAVIRSIGEV
ncbi:MAG: 5-formyltetrahydrofolate cyclo-ligase [Desulfomonilia bacterium]